MFQLFLNILQDAGETLTEAGALTADVDVQAPTWMELQDLRILRNGEVVVTLPLGQISESMTIRGSRPAGASAAPRTDNVIRRPRVGGNVQAAKVIKQVHPIYTEELKQQGITGTVMLRAVISTAGEPLNPEVVNTVDPGLARAALDAFRQWRYQPTLLNGEPVEVVTTVMMRFELEQ